MHDHPTLHSILYILSFCKASWEPHYTQTTKTIGKFNTGMVFHRHEKYKLYHNGVLNILLLGYIKMKLLYSFN